MPVTDKSTNKSKAAPSSDSMSQSNGHQNNGHQGIQPASLETDQRPWGNFTVLEDGPGYKIKRIVVMPKHRLSLQMHYHRSEHWIVVSGTALVTCNGEERLLNSNQSTYVPPCTKHRLENPGVIPLILIEVQNGQYLGEDDIVRFHDDYVRDIKG
jgi:mannose-6-phosphate isomerase